MPQVTLAVQPITPPSLGLRGDPLAKLSGLSDNAQSVLVFLGALAVVGVVVWAGTAVASRPSKKQKGLSGVSLEEIQRHLPLHDPSIRKGGMNREGMTWNEWYNAARRLRRPSNITEENLWSRMWKHGIDPAEVFDIEN